jgi:formylglycine-generating enzyme required for sulfatase activity
MATWTSTTLRFCAGAWLTGPDDSGWNPACEMGFPPDQLIDTLDLAAFSKYWLAREAPDLPPDMVLIPGGTFQMGDHFDEAEPDERPIRGVRLDSFYMGKYEATNRQYCDYPNSAYPGQIKVVSGVVYASSDGGNSLPYCDTSTSSSFSQIAYSGGVFSVRSKSGRNMVNDPMVRVS